MEFIVEVGTPEQKELIENELQTVFNAIPQIDPNLSVYKIIVPVDFDATVNRLLGRSTYRSVRSVGEHQVVAQAKIINTSDGFCIVISSRIFNEQQDSQTRCFIYIHELVHLVNKHKFQFREAHSQSYSIYRHNLETFVDEYIADRVAYELIDRIFPSRSELWQAEVERQAVAFATVLIDPRHMQAIKMLIQQLRIHQDITRFLDEIFPLFDGVFLALAHSFSLSDCYPNQLPTSELTKSEFVNERAIALVDYARNLQSSGDYELSEGMPVIKNFMRNFGIAFTDSPQGLVCRVDYLDF